MPTAEKKLCVFLCHASQDKPVVREVYQRLLGESWIDPWLDEEKILPGQDWNLEIKKALVETDAVIVSLSDVSLKKEGHVRRELTDVLEKLKEKPPDSNYFIPVRLEDCSVPISLQQWQYVDYFPINQKDKAFQKLLAGLKLRASILGIGKEEKIQSALIGKAVIEFGQEIALTLQLPTNQLLEFFRGKASKFLNTDNIFIVLSDKNQDGGEAIKFQLVYENGSPSNWATQRVNPNIGFVREVIQTKQSIFLPTRKEIQNWFEKHPNEKGKANLRSWLGVPMLIRNEVIGVIGVFHPKLENVYNTGDQEVLQTLANLVGIAIDNARLYNEARSDVIAAKQLATLGTVTASLTHRIKNTFNIIIPNIARLRNRIDVTDSTNNEILDIIERNARYTSDIVTRLQRPIRETEYSNINVNALLQEIVESVKAEWNKNPSQAPIKIALDLDESIPLIQFSVEQFSEVIQNLIDNAYRAMNKGGKLTIDSKFKENFIEVRIKDTAEGGIPPAIQMSLFQKPVPSKEPGHGTGLGLWFSNLVLQRAGGNILVERTDATGTTMLVKLPIRD